MPKKTAFLSLTLPEFQEFIDSWHEPVNQNSEDIDAFLLELAQDVGGVSSPVAPWSTLKGTAVSLAARLAVSILPDGTVDLSAAPDILALASSATKGTEVSPDDDPRGRFDRSDFEIYDARQAVVGGRFSPIGASGPTLGYPEEELDAGVAIRLADFGKDAAHTISSPPWQAADGHVSGGASNLITISGGNRRFKIDSDIASNPAVFNIDGYHFRLRESLTVDYAGLTPTPTLGNWMWIYVSRNELDYDDSEILFNQTSGYARKDLRILQSGVTGATSGSNFTQTGALFNTSVIGKVKPGDILVLDDTNAAGKYVILSITDDENLVIRGIFKLNTTAIWHIQDNHAPTLGVIEGTSDPETLPTFVPGRSYIGRVLDNGVAAPTTPTNFAKGGVYDNGWSGLIDVGNFPQVITHNLGALPSRVEIFFRKTATSPVYPALVQRNIMTDLAITGSIAVGGDVKKNILLVPSLYWFATTETVEIRVLNALTNDVSPVGAALFTDSSPADQGDSGNTVQMRVVVTR